MIAEQTDQLGEEAMSVTKNHLPSKSLQAIYAIGYSFEAGLAMTDLVDLLEDMLQVSGVLKEEQLCLENFINFIK